MNPLIAWSVTIALVLLIAKAPGTLAWLVWLPAIGVVLMLC